VANLLASIRFTSIRFIAALATEFMPSTPSAVEELRVTSREVGANVAVRDGDPAPFRVGALLRDEAWPISETFGWEERGPWSLTVATEVARRYATVSTRPGSSGASRGPERAT
jgi:hypothetical protein